MYDLELLLKLKENKIPSIKKIILYRTSSENPFRSLILSKVSLLSKGSILKELDSLSSLYESSLFGETFYILDLLKNPDLDILEPLAKNPQIENRLLLVHEQPYKLPSCSILEETPFNKSTLDLFISFYLPLDSKNLETLKGVLLAQPLTSLQFHTLSDRLLYECYDFQKKEFDLSLVKQVLPQPLESSFISLLEPLYKVFLDPDSIPVLLEKLPSSPRLALSMLYSSLLELMTLSSDMNPKGIYPPSWSQWRIQNNNRYKVSGNQLMRLSQLLLSSEPQLLASADFLTTLSYILKKMFKDNK